MLFEKADQIRSILPLGLLQHSDGISIANTSARNHGITSCWPFIYRIYKLSWWSCLRTAIKLELTETKAQNRLNCNDHGCLEGTFCCPYFTIWVHLKLGTRKGDIMKRFRHTSKASRLRWRGWKSEGQLLEKLQMAGMVLQNWFVIFLFPPDSSNT